MSGAAGYGMIAGAAGGFMQAIAARLAQMKMDQVYQQELDRQAKLRNQAYSIWGPATEYRGVENYNRQLAEGAANREMNYQQIESRPLSFQNTYKQGANAVDQAAYNMMGQRRAALGAYNDAQLMQQINAIRTQNELNKISNFSQGWARVFPLNMYDAQHSQDALQAIGGIVGSLGGAGANFAQLNAMPQTQQASWSPVQPMWDYSQPDRYSQYDPYNTTYGGQLG